MNDHMIRFGVIGTNWITDDFIEAARQTEDFVLTAVYSRSEETGQQFAVKHNVSHVYSNIEEFAASTELDAVYIASPNALHAEQAILCMNNGKHVLCEKPLASNAAEVKRMVVAAAHNHVTLMEAMKTSFLPNFHAIRDNLHKIGTVRRYLGSYCQYSSRYDRYKNGEYINTFNPAFSNGALMDLGIYCIYPLVMLFGQPDKLQANAVMLDSGVDGAGSLLLSYRDMDAVIQYSKIANSYVGTEIQGERGTMIVDHISLPNKVQIQYRDGSIEELTAPQVDNLMLYEVEEFLQLVKSGTHESQVNSHELSLQVMQIMDESRRLVGLEFPADQHPESL